MGKKILEDEGDIELTDSVGSGKEAPDFIRFNLPDNLIADLSMPGMSGIELTEKLAAKYHDIKVLILSMIRNEKSVVSAIRAGARAYLPKQDSTTEILMEAIRTFTSGDEFYLPTVSKIVFMSFINTLKTAGISDIVKRHQLTCRERDTQTLRRKL